MIYKPTLLINNMKVLLHLDLDSTHIFDIALTNAEFFLRDVANPKVAFVANGLGVKLFVKSANGKFRERLEKLSQQGVKFYVCRNALKLHEIDESEIFDFCEKVPNGIRKIVELQSEGYAYVKP